MKPNCLSTTSGVVFYGTTPLLDPLPDTLQASVAPGGHGVFLDLQLPRKKESFDIPLGTIPGLKRFVAWRRFEPYWMVPAFGSAVGEIPKETQGLLYQRDDGLHVLLVPLFGPRFRCALESRDGILQLVADTGDIFAPDASGLAAFIAAGSDPFELLARSAEAVRARLPGARLRREKAAPDFIDDFGWCTWDAFYVSVNPDKVKQGLAALRDAGVPPKTLILDDGWQSVREDDDDLRLTAFAANKKFGGSLKPLVEDAKRDFGIKRFLVWHAFNGYWNGVAPEAFQAFGAHEVPRQFSRDILATHPNYNHQMWWGSGFIWAHAVGLIPPAKIAEFFDAFHTLLAAEGVDGVKVDVQSGLEALSQGQGGRVALFRAYREGLESSVRKHFGGRLINCMCHASENLYLCADSLVTRGSQDFWPGDHRSYALHLVTNAQFGLWFGEWVLPDWDMFHSKHPYGAYNAAGRALSGGPIYVSDKPGEHDATLLKKLVCTDGSILRPDLPGRPTPDTLYRDPGKGGKPMKIFNRVGSAAVVGVFHPVCAPLEGQDDAQPVSGHLRLEDIPGFVAEDCAVFAHSTRKLSRIKRGDSLPYTLTRGGWEIFSLVPVERGVAAIGLADKFISPASIRNQIWRDLLTLELTLRDAGELVLFCEKKPSAVLADAVPIPICFQENLVHFNAPPATHITLRWS